MTLEEIFNVSWIVGKILMAVYFLWNFNEAAETENLYKTLYYGIITMIYFMVI